MKSKRQWLAGMDLSTIDGCRVYVPSLAKRIPLGLAGEYTPADAERLMRGSRSSSMDEKWNIFYRDGWLTFHRSWTGVAVYGIRLEVFDSGAHVTASWINGDFHPCDPQSLEYHRRLVPFLIDVFLLGKPAVFPVPSDMEHLEGMRALAYVHMVVGHVPALPGHTEPRRER